MASSLPSRGFNWKSWFHGAIFFVFVFLSGPSKRSEKDYFQRFQGQLELTLDQAREVTGYSYVTTIGEKMFPENFTQFLSRHRSSTSFKRALKIPNDHIQPGGK